MTKLFVDEKMTEPYDIIDFWFRGVDDATTIKKSDEPFCLWFKSAPEFDAEIRRRFERDLIRARNGELKSWEASPEGRLALILLFDQFSRNIYRGSPQAYAFDHPAQHLVLKIIEEKSDTDYQRIFRLFIYMPLMHAEDIKLQELSVKKYQEMVEEVKNFASRNASYYEWNLSYARQHHRDILTHGRFPYRDKILGR